jgi:hypothetical protein
MRVRAGAPYWIATGAVTGFGLIGLMTIGFPFMVVGLIMAVVGVWRLGVGGIWGFLIGFGGLPALVFLSNILEGIRTALNPYCAQSRGLGTPASPATGSIEIPPGVDQVECALIPGSYYMMFVIFAAVALLGVTLGLLLRRRFRVAAAGERGEGL